MSRVKIGLYQGKIGLKIVFDKDVGIIYPLELTQKKHCLK
jgi:hypothetical protein